MAVLLCMQMEVADIGKHHKEGMVHKGRAEESSMDRMVDTHNLEAEEVGEGMDMDCCKGMKNHNYYPFFQQENIKRKLFCDSL